jgi:uncharacterized membrane protein
MYNTQVLNRFLKDSKLKIPFSSIQTAVSQQPMPNNITCLTNVLAEFGFESLSLQLEFKDVQKLLEFPKPFIAHTVTPTNSGDFVVVSEVKDDLIRYFHVADGEKEVSFKEFETTWSGVAIVSFQETVQTNVWQMLQYYREKYYTSLNVMALLVGGMFCYTAVHSLFFTIILLLKIIGVYASIQIIRYELGFSSQFAQRLCSTLDSQGSSCKNIVNSEKASILGVKWSHLGLFYFLGCFLTLSLAVFGNSVSTILNGLSFFTIPTFIFTGYSIWFQRYVMTEWCRLCLFLLLIFFFETLIFAYYAEWDFYSFVLNWKNIGTISTGFGVAAFVSYYWVELLSIDNQKTYYAKKWYQTKMNPKIIASLWNAAKYIEVKGAPTLTFQSSEEDKELHIIVITSPSCQTCRENHITIEKQAKQLKAKVDVLFSVNPYSEKETDSYKVIERLFQLYENNQIQMFHDAMNKWFSNKEITFKVWEKKFIPTVEKDVTSHIIKQFEWCEQHEIKHTPTILLNGRILPDIYEIADIANLI